MKNKRWISECIIGVVLLVFLVCLKHAIDTYSVLQTEIPDRGWFLLISIGIIVWCYGLLYVSGIQRYFPAKRWRKVTVLSSVSVLVLHTLIISGVYMLSSTSDPMWLLTGYIIDYPTCFFLNLIEMSDIYVTSAFFVLGGLWYALAVVCVSRIAWLITASVKHVAGKTQ